LLAQGDHQIETHPGLGRRMMVAAGIALCLFLLGLAATARAAAPLTIAAHHVKLVPVAPAVILPMGLFSRKITNLDQLEDGDRIAVANDPVNRARGLQLFAKAGLIRLTPRVVMPQR
jgi:putative ubiquitin-RnfH superfamily antitoxin RatB of RatAB toxin-antitoxin module